MNNHCRISKVRFKDGKTISLLPPSPMRNRQFMADANKMLNHQPNIDGYLIIVWDAKLGYSYSYNVGDVDAMKPGLMPAWIHDLLLREVTKNDLIYRDDTGEGA